MNSLDEPNPIVNACLPESEISMDGVHFTEKVPIADYMEVVQDAIEPDDRSEMVGVIFGIAREKELSPCLVHLAVGTIDLYLSIQAIDFEEKEQIACGCLYANVKNEDPDKLGMLTFDEWIDDMEVQKMSDDIVEQLDYGFSTATTHFHVGKFYQKFGGANENEKKLEHLSYLLADLALFDYGMLCYPTSLVAASCILLARHMLAVMPLWSVDLVRHTTYEASKLRGCVSRLHGEFCGDWHKNLRSSSYAVLMEDDMDSLNHGQIPANIFSSQ